jgi:hypothetical protein
MFPFVTPLIRLTPGVSTKEKTEGETIIRRFDWLYAF